MPHAELDHLEGDVRDARRRLKSDLEILRAPETFSSFKEEVLDEARQSRDGIVANVKEAATDRAERLVVDIKARAAANPVAVGAIAAGVAWRILRKPPTPRKLSDILARGTDSSNQQRTWMSAISSSER